MWYRYQGTVLQDAEGCKYRDHKVKVKNPKDSEMYLTLMTHRYAKQLQFSYFTGFS